MEDRTAGSWILPIALLIAVIPLTAAMTLAKGAGGPGAPMVAVFPPTWSADRVVSAAVKTGAAIVGFGPWDWIIVLVPRDTAEAEAVQASGALVLLNSAAAAFCGAAARTSPEAVHP